MNEILLSASDLGKAYRRHENVFSRFLSWFGIRTGAVDENWVLRHVSFNVVRGEAIGIVGQNGAGKSTLLKLITGTTRSTEGRVYATGRIAAILELGMGFNPDLTGRENARHALGLMGVSAGQAAQVMPSVEDFAEIGEYFDLPIRIYSSGMQMRVAFSVATAVRPDVLIVDEALSVGDAYFQHKSFDRIRQFQQEGTTLLIVSHDRAAVQSLCGRAILLDQGRLIKDGDPEGVMDYYNALIAERENQSIRVTQLNGGRLQTVSGSGEAEVVEIGLFSADGFAVEFVNVGERVSLRVRVRAHASIRRLVFGYMLKDRLGQPVYGTNTHHTQQALESVPAGATIDYTVNFPMNIGAGTYSVSTALVSSDTHLVNNYEWRDLALIFTVANLDKPGFVGSAWVPPCIELVVS